MRCTARKSSSCRGFRAGEWASLTLPGSCCCWSCGWDSCCCSCACWLLTLGCRPTHHLFEDMPAEAERAAEALLPPAYVAAAKRRGGSSKLPAAPKL